MIDPVGVHDDQALLGLPENLRQMHGRQNPAPEHISKGEARPHRGQLVGVAHQNQPLALGDCLQKAVQQLYVHHGHFIHDHRIAL